MDVRQFGILQFLGRGSLTQRQLTDLVAVDKSTLVRIIDQLEDQRLAQRARDPNDRRAFQVTITERGRRQVAAANAAATELGEQLFGWMNPPERQLLHQTLQQIIQRAGSY